MAAPEYLAPESIDALVAALAAHAPGEVRALAGGTDLIVQMRAGVRRPRRIVDLKRVPDFTRIALSDSEIRIGAAVPAAQIVEHPTLSGLIPGLVEAVDLIGSTQIQGRATLGGNLCNASPAADTVPALVALDARCRIVGPKGERELAVADVVTGPGATSLGAAETVCEFLVARPGAHSRDAYLRLIPRSEMDIAVAGAGVSLTLDAKGICTQARVALGAVGPTVLLVGAAADALVGSAVDDAALGAVQAACSAAARPIDDKRGTVSYRRTVAGVLTSRAARIAADRARQRRN